MQNHNELVLSLQPESERSMQIVFGASLLLGLGLAYWLGSLEFLLDRVFFTEAEKPQMSATVRIVQPAIPKPQPEQTVKPVSPSRPKASGNPATPKGNPDAPRSVARLRLLTSQVSGQHLNAYQMFENTSVSQDVDKILSTNATITRTGNTVLGQTRGKTNGGFNSGFGEGGSGGLGNTLDRLLGGPAGPVGSRAIMGAMVAPKVNEISIGNDHAGRSAAEIQQVVRARMPGLRYIYNRYLKRVPGLAGTVSLRFTILPGGEVAQCEIVRHTTGNDAFAEEIRTTVQTWTFQKVKSGNTTVTIPFSFTE